MEEFTFIPPMKAHTSSVEFLEQVDGNGEWCCGEKFDGFREQWHFGAIRNELLSSAGNSHIAKVPQFQFTVPGLANTILDCEGLSSTRYLEDNAACFKADPVNAIAWQKTHGAAHLVVFDILSYKNRDITSLPFVAGRRVYLEMAMEELWAANCAYKELVKLEDLRFISMRAYWNEIVSRAQNEGHEGVILKAIKGTYQSGKRSNYWLKVKREETLECTIRGYIGGTGQFTDMVGSIHFTSEGGIEGYTSGMTYDERKDMTKHFEDKYRGHRCYIGCQEVTRLGALRHPRYLGMVDKEKKDVL